MSNSLNCSNSYFDVYQKQIPSTSTTSNVTNATSTTLPSFATRSSNGSLCTQQDRNEVDVRNERNKAMTGKGLMPRTKTTFNKSPSLSYNLGGYSTPPSTQQDSSKAHSGPTSWNSAYNSLDYESMTSDVIYKQLSTRIDSLLPQVSTSTSTLSDIPRSHLNFSRPSSSLVNQPSSLSLSNSNSNSNLTNYTSTSSSTSSIKSIDEIARQQPTIRRSKTSVSRISLSPPRINQFQRSTSEMEVVVDDDLDQSRSSIDSLEVELAQSLKFSPIVYRTPEKINKTSQGDMIKRSPSSTDYLHSPSFRPLISSSPSSRNLTPSPSKQNLTSSELATLLKSPRLTRIITLQRPSPLQNIKISLADVGLSTSNSVVLISLGLGCTRYLIGLYDELATILGLRLIIIDRPGYGFTSELKDQDRNFKEWSLIQNEILSEHLGIQEYSLLAHSAGCPYSLALALNFPEKVVGIIQLLAPWVVLPNSNSNANSNEVECLIGSYRLLKFVPASVLKKVQEVEWKVQEFKIGKPPTQSQSQEVGIGFDRINSISTEEVDTLPSLNNSPNGITYFNNRPLTTLSRSPSLPVLPPRSRNLSTPSPPPSKSNSTNNLRSSSSYSTALLQASHSESLNGTTSDLRVLLSSSSSPSSILTPDSTIGIDYSKIKNEAKIWLGDKDEKISLGSIKWLEKELINGCQVEIVLGGNHNLMTNGKIMIEVLESIAEDWKSR